MPQIKRSFKNFDEEDFLLDFTVIDWNKIITEKRDPNRETNTLINKITELVDKHAPLIKISKKKSSN